MNNLFRQRENHGRQPVNFEKAFNGLFDWLAGFVSLTEEEQKDAGIYPGYHTL